MSAAGRPGSNAATREIRRGDPEYPASLGDLERPPRQLYAIGDVGALKESPRQLVAIVGTRDATSYGLRVAKALAGALAESGAVVVSGMARGVDSAAHEGALAGGGATIAVLGTGPDVPYPAGNSRLHRSVAAAGLVLSESPPGTTAFPGCFPRRNRIIAALAKVTVVVEAGFKSGALNTASQALELGRIVAAVPGPIDSPRSSGSNVLIRDGAQVITSAADAIALIGLSNKRTVKRPNLGPCEAEVWDAINKGSDTVDGLVVTTGLSGRQVMEALGSLEVVGLATISFDGRVVAADLPAGNVVSTSIA